MLEYLKSGRFIETVIVVLIGVAIILIGDVLDKKYFKTKSSNNKWYKSSKMILDFINTILIVILLLIILSINGVNVGKYVTSLGVIGIILSFALQDILKDVIMGLSIMFEGYFKVGDVVIYREKYGKVVSFNIKTTKLFLLDDESTTSICNRDITQIAIASDWIDVDVPIGYDVDLRRSRSLCRECAKRIERLRYVYSCDFLNTQELAESWITYRLRIHCLAEKRPGVRRNAQAVIQDVFYEHGQEFPLSIKVLYMSENKANAEASEDTFIASESSDNTVSVSSYHSKRKYDYELGRGAEKSKVIPFDGTDKTINNAVNEAERYATSENLGNSMKLRLRLISEELLAFTKSIPQLNNGSFYIERDGADYDICFDADGKLTRKTREQLLEVSSNNKNGAYSGVSGLLSRALDSMVQMSINDREGINSATRSTMEESIGKSENDYSWSYNIYKEKEDNANNSEALNEISEDGIGKSVLMRMSDDIRIAIRTNRVGIRVLVKGEDDEA